MCFRAVVKKLLPSLCRDNHAFMSGADGAFAEWRPSLGFVRVIPVGGLQWVVGKACPASKMDFIMERDSLGSSHWISAGGTAIPSGLEVVLRCPHDNIICLNHSCDLLGMALAWFDLTIYSVGTGLALPLIVQICSFWTVFMKKKNNWNLGHGQPVDGSSVVLAHIGFMV